MDNNIGFSNKFFEFYGKHHIKFAWGQLAIAAWYLHRAYVDGPPKF